MNCWELKLWGSSSENNLNQNILKDIVEIFEKEENKNLFDNSISIDEWISKFKIIYEENFKEKHNLKFGEFMMIIRKSITAKEKTPNLYYVFEVLGRERVISRLR